MYKRLWIHCKKRRYFIGDAVTCSVCIHIGLLLSWCNQVPCPAKEFCIIINLLNLLSSTWSVPIMNFAGIVGSYSRQDAVKAMSLKQSFKKAHQSTKLNIWASYSYSTKFERHLLTKVCNKKKWSTCCLYLLDLCSHSLWWTFHGPQWKIWWCRVEQKYGQIVGKYALHI